MEQGRLADEHQIVRAGEVLAEQPEFAQTIGGHEVGVINDGDEHFTGAMDAEGLLDELAFTTKIVAFKLDLEGFAEDPERVVMGVEGGGRGEVGEFRGGWSGLSALLHQRHDNPGAGAPGWHEAAPLALAEVA